ncbi:putrescine ABC transporter, periplasmic putrescine-binding domain protein [Burkholderia sp. ABCPW 111]|nr:putrescine ABC transporter, periplasmic putrescine-binding domain protein [Burkholderia sp. ABCPW 111]
MIRSARAGHFSGWTRADNPIKLRPPAASRCPAVQSKSANVFRLYDKGGKLLWQGRISGSFRGFQGAARNGAPRRRG